MMALAGVELEMLVSEPDALTTRPPPCVTTRLSDACRSHVLHTSTSTNKFLQR